MGPSSSQDCGQGSGELQGLGWNLREADHRKYPGHPGWILRFVGSSIPM